jgi:AraC-like DNA-binding protein
MWIEPANAATERPQAVICRQLLGLLNLDVDSSDAGVAVACGAIHATFQQSAGLFDQLREPIVEDVSDSAILKNAFPELAEEMRESRPGTAEIVSCILKRCLIGILRRLLVDAGEQPAWLLALENPRFGRVLAAMLDRPAHAHTLESLADIAGMSRSVFAQQFSTAFNRTAMSFLREIRLRRAARQLQATNLSVKAIAAAAGFRSRSYFWRVFKELHGVDPAGFRTRCQANR